MNPPISAGSWVCRRILVLSRTPALLSGGTKPHNRGTRKRWASPARLCILPWTSPIPITCCLPQPARCAQNVGEMSPNFPPCLARSPHGSLQAHHAVMGRKLTHPMDWGQSWGHHLRGSRPRAAAFEEPFFDRKYNFVTPHPSSKCGNFCSSDPLSI